MNKNFNKIFIVILTALLLAGLMTGNAFATYAGETDYGKSIMGQDYNNSRQFFATGTAGQAIPTAGLFPVAGSDGTNARMVKVDSDGNLQVDILTMAGAEYAGTDGTNGPSKAASIGGTDSSGYLQEISVDSDGQLQIDVLSLPSVTIGGTNFTTTAGSTTAPASIAIVGGKNNVTGLYAALNCDDNGVLYVNKSTNVENGDNTAPTFFDAKAAVDYGGTYRQARADSEGRSIGVNLTFKEALSAVGNTTTTDETTMVAAPAGGNHIMPISLVLSGQNAGEFTVRNGVAGTIIGRYYIAAGGNVILGPEQLSHCSDASAITVQSTAQPYSWTIKYQTLTP